MFAFLITAQSSTERDGVNVLPILLVLIAIGVGVYLWRRKR
jgi:hypothetical protein